MSRRPALPGPRFLVRVGGRHPRRRYWLWSSILTGGLIAIVTAWRLTHPRAVPVTYRSLLVERGDLRVTISAAGDVEPQNRIELKPPLAGRIEKILVREGDDISKGQILAWISSNDRAGVLDAARAKGPEEVARWEDAYKPTPLVAPLGGFIIARRAEPGQTVSSGDSPLVMADRLIVKAQVDETDLGKVKIGLPCQVSLDAYPEIRLPGRVDHIAYEARNVNNVTVYDIEVELSRGSRVMRSGMTATVTVIVAERRGVLVVPADALTEQDGVLGVLTPRPGKAPPVLSPVKLGLADGAQVEVVEGVAEGATVLIASNAVPVSHLSDAKNPFMPAGMRQRSSGAKGGGTGAKGGGGWGGRR